MTIGVNWAEGSYVTTSWVSSAWLNAARVFTAAIQRIQSIAASIRTQIIEP